MGKIIQIQYNGSLGYKVPITTVKEHFKITISDEDFLMVKNEESGLTNAQVIFDAYSTRTRIALDLADSEGNDVKDASFIRGDMPCPIPIILYVDTENLVSDVLLSQSNILADDFQVDSFNSGGRDSAFTISDNQFFQREILTFDDLRTSSIKDNEYASGRRGVPRPTVWVWCKSLNEGGVFNSHSIFNLTPFVESLSINQTESGGNFNVKLLSIDGVFDIDDDGEPTGIWHPNEKRYIKFEHNERENFLFKSIIDKIGSRRDEDFSSVTFGKRFQNINSNNVNQRDREFKEGAELDYNRTETLFKNMISENDVIFISFSQIMDLRSDDLKDDFFISNSDLPDGYWDMIGLVDSNQIQVSYENSNIDLNLTGRDLMKLLIEDGSYFFAKSFSNPDNTNSAFSNVDLPNRGDDNNASNVVIQEQKVEGINRLMTTGMIDVLYNPEARNVNFIMNLLMSRLSNIEICYSDLFDFYGDKRTEFTVPFFETVDSDLDNEADRNEDLD